MISVGYMRYWTHLIFLFLKMFSKRNIQIGRQLFNYYLIHISTSISTNTHNIARDDLYLLPFLLRYLLPEIEQEVIRSMRGGGRRRSTWTLADPEEPVPGQKKNLCSNQDLFILLPTPAVSFIFLTGSFICPFEDLVHSWEMEPYKFFTKAHLLLSIPNKNIFL